MNSKAQEVLNKILIKEPGSLTEEEIRFLRARRFYLKEIQLREYDSVLNPKVNQTSVKTETVKIKNANPK